MTFPYIPPLLSKYHAVLPHLFIKDNSFDDASFIELNTFNQYPCCSKTPPKQGIAMNLGKIL